MPMEFKIYRGDMPFIEALRQTPSYCHFDDPKADGGQCVTNLLSKDIVPQGFNIEVDEKKPGLIYSFHLGVLYAAAKHSVLQFPPELNQAMLEKARQSILKSKSLAGEFHEQSEDKEIAILNERYKRLERESRAHVQKIEELENDLPHLLWETITTTKRELEQKNQAYKSSKEKLVAERRNMDRVDAKRTQILFHLYEEHRVEFYSIGENLPTGDQ